jgi:hypothetical protein
MCIVCLRGVFPAHIHLSNVAVVVLARLAFGGHALTQSSLAASPNRAALRRRLPEFTISYTPDFRDAIAKTWPASIDDSAARTQWGWQPKYGEETCYD